MKICSDCSETKTLDQFNKKGNGYQGKCRDCQKLWYKSYYENSPKEKKRLFTHNEKQKNTLRSLVREKKNVPCSDCGVRYPYYVMDFDHLHDKLYNIGNLVAGGNISRVMKEIEKCEVVCSNCHRQRTHGRLDKQESDVL